MNKKIRLFWLFPIILLSGIFGFYTSSFSFFIFKTEIDIVGLVALIITSTLGIYIASTLQKNYDANKIEKDLLFQRINPLHNKINGIEKYLVSNNLKFNETIKSFKDISSLISELNEYNKLCELIDPKQLETFRELFSELKPLITGGTVLNEKLVLSAEHKQLSKQKLINFKSKIIKLIIDINRK